MQVGLGKIIGYEGDLHQQLLVMLSLKVPKMLMFGMLTSMVMVMAQICW